MLLTTPPIAYIVEETVRKETFIFLVKCLMYKKSAEQNCFWGVRIKLRRSIVKENRIVSYIITILRIIKLVLFCNCEFGAFICCLVSGVGFRGWKGVIEIWRGWITVSPQYSQNIQQKNKVTSTSKSCRERYSDVFINLPILYLILLVGFFPL